MMTGLRVVFSLQICICALLFIGSPSEVWARFSPMAAGSSEFAPFPAGRAGGRGLLQSGTVNSSFNVCGGGVGQESDDSLCVETGVVSHFCGSACPLASCFLGPYDLSKIDYTSVTSVCKGPNYDVNVCCAPFTKLACQYKPQINDFNSLCPLYFLSYLNVAGSYPAGVFVGQGRCNNGNNLCSS